MEAILGCKQNLHLKCLHLRITHSEHLLLAGSGILGFVVPKELPPPALKQPYASHQRSCRLQEAGNISVLELKHPVRRGAVVRTGCFFQKFSVFLEASAGGYFHYQECDMSSSGVCDAYVVFCGATIQQQIPSLGANNSSC